MKLWYSLGLAFIVTCTGVLAGTGTHGLRHGGVNKDYQKGRDLCTRAFPSMDVQDVEKYEDHSCCVTCKGMMKSQASQQGSPQQTSQVYVNQDVNKPRLSPCKDYYYTQYHPKQVCLNGQCVFQSDAQACTAQLAQTDNKKGQTLTAISTDGCEMQYRGDKADSMTKADGCPCRSYGQSTYFALGNCTKGVCDTSKSYMTIQDSFSGTQATSQGGPAVQAGPQASEAAATAACQHMFPSSYSKARIAKIYDDHLCTCMCFHQPDTTRAYQLMRFSDGHACGQNMTGKCTNGDCIGDYTQKK